MSLRSVVSSVLVSLVATSALAQNSVTTSAGSQETRRPEYISDGFVFGGSYEHLSMDVKIKVRDKTTGKTYEASGKTDEALDLAGARLVYAKMPKSGVGINMGGLIQKINGQGASTEGKTNLLIKGEGNMSIATAIASQSALYGFGGAHLAHVSEFSQEVEPLGFGLQLGVGLAINSNLSLEAGYSITAFQFKDKSVVDANSNLELNKTESSVAFKGLITRASYSF